MKNHSANGMEPPFTLQAPSMPRKVLTTRIYQENQLPEFKLKDSLYNGKNFLLSYTSKLYLLPHKK